MSFRMSARVVGVWLVLASLAGAEDKGVAKSTSASATLLQRSKAGDPWRPVDANAPVAAGQQLLALPGEEGELVSADGAVRIALRGNLPELSHFPVLESAITLNKPADNTDADFTLQRGRVDVTNTKLQGAARVVVRFHGERWEITLTQPGTRVVLEHFSRWPRGVPFHKGKDRPAEDVPTADVFLVVVKGEAELNAGQHHYGLRAPKGPALFHWDSVVGHDRGPKNLDELPNWTRPDDDAKARSLREAAARQRKQLQDRPAAEVLAAELRADDEATRELAVFGLAAIDALPQLVEALGDEKHGDAREIAVEALRHWIARANDHDQKLYAFLIEERGYSEGHAEIVLQLLHSFAASALARPETFEALIAYLRHDKLPIRELAKWHLYRLVPAGKEIKYDPAAGSDQRERAYKQWKELIPDGKLPPRPGGK